MRIDNGDIVVTGKDGEVHIIMDDRGLIAMRANSRLRVDDYAANGDEKDRAVYTLLGGFIRSVTGWIGKVAPQNYRVRAANATVGIRGTDHEVGLIEKGEGAGTYSKVNEGETTLGNSAGEASVKAGRAAFVDVGKATMPRLLDRVPPVFQATANETAIDATRKKLAADLDDKLRQRREEIKRSGGTDVNGNTRINESCIGGTAPIDELMAFIRAYESGNVAMIQTRLDPSMLGYQRFLDGLIQDFNRQKQIRLFIKDTQVQCGSDLATVQFTWEKRYLDVGSFAPAFLTGRGITLLHRGSKVWRIAGFAGDNPFSSLAGTMGQLTFGPAFSLTSISAIPTSVPVTVQVVDSDLAGLGSLTVQIVTTLGDAETVVLPETSPGRFMRSSLMVATGAAARGNGIVEVANGVQLTLRYVDQSPGNNLPATMLTQVLRPTGSILFTPDTTPDPFSFTPVLNAPTSALTVSNAVTISGINAPSSITVVGGEYAIDAGPFTGSGGTVTNGQQVRVRTTASPIGGGGVAAMLNIGSVQGVFAVTTAVTGVTTNSTPNAFVFNSISNAATSQLFTSSAAMISSINVASPISIIGGQYSINGGPFTSAAGFVTNGQSVAVQLLSSSANLTTMSATLSVGGMSGTFSVTTAALAGISTPAPFGYSPQSNVAQATLIDSLPAAITGINVASPVTIVGGLYSINGGAFTAATGSITNGQALTVRVLSSATFGATTAATVNVGGVAATFSVTTPLAMNTMPSPFVFNSVSNALLNQLFTSNVVTISGINISSPVSIIGGSYAINGGPFTTAAGSITNGQRVAVQLLSSAANLTTSSATLNIGGVSGTFSVTTAPLAGISTPAPFSYNPQINVAPSTLIDSAPATISGINVASPVTIVGGLYSINGGTFTAAVGSITNGQTLVVRVLSSAAASTSTATTVNVGGVAATFSATTSMAANPVPMPFIFNSISNAATGRPFTSNAVTISGINVASPVAISGGSYSINGGSFTAAAGSITNGQSVIVQLQSSATNATTTSATLNVGGVAATFSVTTAPLAGVSTPAPFSYSPQSNVAQATLIDSLPAGITGINVASPVTIVGGLYSINGGAFTAAAGSITNGQTLTVRVLSSAAFGAITAATVNVGGIAATFSVTTARANSTPNAFSFTPQIDVAPRATVTSNAVAITGINIAAPVSIVGGTYSINGGAYTAAAGNITNNQTITVQLTASFTTDGTGRAAATMSVGGITATFNATTWDTAPNAFAFFNLVTSRTGPPACITATSLYTTAAVVITGLTVPTNAFISAAGANPGAQMSINGGAFTTASTPISNGQTIAVRVNTVGINTGATPVTRAIVSIGGISANVTQTCQ
ncbi:MAG: FecR family protein [Burkholderiales bacterium]|nr:FecR family protein [Burkholderiales bacterium]